MLVRLGYDLEAKAVLIAERDMQRKLGRFGFYGNVKKLLYKWTLGYGYEPRRALFLLLILAFVGAGVFGQAYEHGVLKASKKDEELPRFVPLSYSFDVLVPVINLRQKEFWMPNSDSTAGIAVSSYYCFHVLAGWYLTLGGVAAVTGLIRK